MDRASFESTPIRGLDCPIIRSVSVEKVGLPGNLGEDRCPVLKFADEALKSR